MKRSHVVRGSAAFAVAAAIVTISASASQAVTETAITVGSQTQGTWTWKSTSSFGNASLKVWDTKCDAHSARGRFQFQDQNGDLQSFQIRENEKGCGESQEWTGLSGSSGSAITKLRVRTYTAGTDYTEPSDYVSNPYW
ncbi:hypothetical protein GCM10022223_25410 [Kineosporia mesophila]|uniref:Secreted protein n=1 Tax=Kineosporia mesophila TaxID=566012 RepID=A0ABP6ZHX9_9ACTN|nr:hypothetical protein [Kineosporia mesophila]MCD5350574.1 hypothetical protein [Kineosporia mesophila]